MNIPSDHIVVLGHRNPDTDASASAQAYATFLRRADRYDAPVSAGVLGGILPQTRHVFERAGVAPPCLVESVLPRVCDVATRRVHALARTDRFGSAVETMIRTGVSMLPIIGDGGKLHSVLSDRGDIGRYFFALDVIPLVDMLLTWEDLVALPGGRSEGAMPDDPRLRGRLRVALEGDRGWLENLEPEDLLVCGDLAVLDRIPAERLPSWVAVMGCETAGSAERIADLASRGTRVMTYAGSVTDFLLALLPQVRVESLELGTGPCVGDLDALDDVRSIVLEHRHALPVLDRDGRVTGVISRSDLLQTPRRRVILIDHFESAQSVRGIEQAEILEIIDHHRVGDIETASPVRVDCRPLGSSCTIVALRFFETDIPPDAATATLLLGGLVSDTVCLRSPTATEVDRRVAGRLAEIGGLDVERFGREVLEAGDDLLIADPASIWARDQKVFSVLNHTFAVAQLETVALAGLPGERLDRLRELLAADFERRGYLVSLLLVTDVLEGTSWIAACESSIAAGVVAACFGETLARPGWTLAPGVVSRKKQVIPPLLAALARCAL